MKGFGYGVFVVLYFASCVRALLSLHSRRRFTLPTAYNSRKLINNSRRSHSLVVLSAYSDDIPDGFNSSNHLPITSNNFHLKHARRMLITSITFGGLVSAAVAAPEVSSSGSIDAQSITATSTATTAAAEEAAAAAFATAVQATRELNSDEFIIDFTGDSLGLKLSEVQYKGFPVVTVRDIKDAALRQLHQELEPGAVVTAVNGVATDGVALTTIAQMVSSSERPVSVKFRDPSRFFRQLDSTAGPPRRIVSTSYLPANTRDAGSPEQRIIVERISMPPAETRLRAAQLLDVLEIQYVAQLQSDPDGKIVDSSAERSAPGTSSKSIYYVLGQQNGPPGKFPTAGWDVTLRGMVAGEKRRITLPSRLAYDRRGDRDRGIPPNAAMIYTIKLLSIT